MQRESRWATRSRACHVNHGVHQGLPLCCRYAVGRTGTPSAFASPAQGDGRIGAMRLGNRSHRLLEPGIFLDAAWVEGISLYFDNMNCADFRASSLQRRFTSLAYERRGRAAAITTRRPAPTWPWLRVVAAYQGWRARELGVGCGSRGTSSPCYTPIATRYSSHQHAAK